MNFSAAQEHCPPEKPFAIRYSLFAAVIGSAEALSSQFVHRLKSVATKTKPVKAGWHKKVASCGLRVQRKILLPNTQPSTLNSQPN